MSRYEQMIAARRSRPILRSIPGLVECCCRRCAEAVLQYERYTEELAHSLIDEFIESGRCDGAEQYAQQIRRG